MIADVIPSDTPATVSSLRTTGCPVCGYALAGLPYPGTCPECGTEYDPSILVLSGVACGNHANLGSGKLGMGIWVLAGAATPGLMLLLGSNRLLRMLGMLHLGLVVCQGLVMFARRRSLPPNALSQLWVCRLGAAQADSAAADPLTVTAEGIISYMLLGCILVFVGSYFLVWPNLAIMLIIFMICLGAALVIPWRLRRPSVSRLRQLAVAQVPALLRHPHVFKTLLPWDRLHDLKLERQAPDLWRLSLRHRSLWLNMRMIDIELQLTDDQVTELKALIADWAAPVG